MELQLPDDTVFAEAVLLESLSPPFLVDFAFFCFSRFLEELDFDR